MKTDCFLPRYNAIECFHKPGNHLFGIKFRVSPVLYEKKVNFAEYKDAVFPLSYLLDQFIINEIKKAGSFAERTAIASGYFTSLSNQDDGSLQQVNIVSTILENCVRQNDFTVSLEQLAHRYKISVRTLQRYFETCTGISSKQALQVMRIRKATAHLVGCPGDFHYSLYNYYDHSHFYKHLKQFLQKNTLKNLQPHLELLKALHR